MHGVRPYELAANWPTIRCARLQQGREVPSQICPGSRGLYGAGGKCRHLPARAAAQSERCCESGKSLAVGLRWPCTRTRHTATSCPIPRDVGSDSANNACLGICGVFGRWAKLPGTSAGGRVSARHRWWQPHGDLLQPCAVFPAEAAPNDLPKTSGKCVAATAPASPLLAGRHDEHSANA